MANLTKKRKKLIVDATKDLLLKEGYDAITMLHISKKLGLNRALLYRVFKNKNEVLLEIINERLEVIVNKLEVSEIKGEKFLVLLIDLFDKDKYLSILLPILTNVIEEKTSLEYVILFRKRYNEAIEKLIVLLEERLALERKNAKFLMLNMLVLIQGTYPCTHLSERQMEINNLMNIKVKYEFQKIVTINIITIYRNLLKK